MLHPTPPVHSTSSSTPRRSVLFVALVILLLGATSAWGQLSISIAYQGPSAPTNGGSVDPGGVYIIFPGPCSAPSSFWSPLSLGLSNYGIYNSREIDAMSWGKDSPLKRDGDYWGGNYRLQFSTDEFASGDPVMGTPTVRSEGAAGNLEASADVQLSYFMMSQLAPSPTAFYSHQSAYDGDCVFPFGGPGMNLVEPNSPTPGADSGDTLDALDVWQQASDMRLYFSLDADWLDPLEGGYGNSGSAQANGVDASDVLVSNGMGGFGVWAPAAMLGLDANDDLDALILHENGNGVFNASAEPFDWMDGTTDMLLFSVRRGSPVIGLPDSKWGWPIEEGDILTTPCSIAPCVGGPRPAIFIHAESLGLGTVRNATDFPFVGYGDDLDAMMVR